MKIYSSLTLLLFAVSVESTFVVVMSPPQRVHRSVGYGAFPLGGDGFGSPGGLDGFGSFLQERETLAMPGWAMRREEELRESMQFDQEMQQLVQMMRSMVLRVPNWDRIEPAPRALGRQDLMFSTPRGLIQPLPASSPVSAEDHGTTAAAPSGATATHHAAVIALAATVTATCAALLVAAALRRRRRLRAYADELEADSDSTSLYTPLLV